MYQNFHVNSTITVLADYIKPVEPPQTRHLQCESMHKDLERMLAEGEHLDCTIVVPKAKREFKVRSIFCC